jgi:uncharacterized protein (DUF169 family)
MGCHFGLSQARTESSRELWNAFPETVRRVQCWDADGVLRKVDILMGNTTEVHSSSYPLLEQVTDTRWIGVKFLKYLSAGRDGVPCGVMRFCEAVRQASHTRIDLSPEVIRCAGAKRAFGWMKNKDEALALHLSEKAGMDADRARALVRQVPVLGYSYAGVRIGDCANPDVLVTYARPEAAMRLVRLWETVMSRSLHVDVSSIMAVCGNAVVKAYMSQSISVSFGCPDSRQYGGIQPEEMVIAVPTGLLDHFDGIVNSGFTSPPQERRFLCPHTNTGATDADTPLRGSRP